MALAIYRKYRPKIFADLLGQESTASILKNAARQNRIGHAYLFYGSRGTGKTTAARLLAKVINCETRQTDPKFGEEGEPCNHCARCAEIDAGRALDVIEIDAASNRGIDEIRDIKEGIRVSPVSYPYKVFIIDEVHMLTGPAFNALLKTLEEPPAHSIFILATTEFEKMPATIVSRTQRFVFKKILKKIIIQKITDIATKETINIDEHAIELIAAASDGSVRDAESLLDQIAAFNEPNTPITLEKTEQVLGKIGSARIDEFVGHLLTGQRAKALESIAAMHEAGYNVVQFTKDLIHYFRRVLSLAADPKLEPLMENDLTGEELTRIKAHGASVNFATHIPLLRALIEAYTEMRYSPFASIPLEVALIEHLK